MSLRRLLRAAALTLAVTLPVAFSTSAEAAPPKKKPRPAAPKPAEKAPEPAERPTPESTDPKRAAAKAGGPVEVTFTDVAGDLAYLKPGTSAGVRRGSVVTLRGKKYKVIGATASHAVVVASPESVKEGDRATATTAEESDDKADALPAPRPLAAFAGAWPEATPLAATQRPRYVPLGSADRGSESFKLLLSSSAFALVPLDDRGGGLGRGELRARVHAAPFSAPLTLDLDGAVQGYVGADLSARDGSRPIARVRELLLGYGRATTLRAGLGRMRYAASTLGTLDGVRVDVPLGGVARVSAFGGLLPEPLSGGVAADAQRFGVEARFADATVDVRPEVAVVAHGSTFKGQLDERRVSALVGLYPGRSRIGGHVEVSSFDKDNPFKAAPVELSAAGLDASLRVGPVQVGGRVDVRQQERSLYLASFLPLSFFCRTAPAAATPGAADACIDGRGSQRTFEAVDASLELGNVGLALGGTAQQTVGGAANLTGGFASARVVRIARVLRLEAAGQLAKGSFIDLVGGSAGPGLSLWGDTIDISAYYRLGRFSYRIDDKALTEHAVGGMLLLLPASELVVTLQGEGRAGDDTSALLALLNLLWRPRL